MSCQIIHRFIRDTNLVGWYAQDTVAVSQENLELRSAFVPFRLIERGREAAKTAWWMWPVFSQSNSGDFTRKYTQNLICEIMQEAAVNLEVFELIRPATSMNK